MGLRIKSNLKEYKIARARIEAEVKSVQSRQINNLISQLKNSDSFERANAVRQLVQFGSAISREDFNKTVDIMRHGRDESRKKLYRQSHCTWYEYTQSRYYAAKTLIAMKSTYVNDQLIGEAKRAKAKGRSKRRVNDPGWF